MSRQLPPRPNLEYLKNQAKDLLRELQQRNPSAQLADAQHALAREYGCASWPKLKALVEEASTSRADEPTVIKFVVAHGRIASRDRISRASFDRELFKRACRTLARLRAGETTLPLTWADGTAAVVGLGLQQAFEMFVERLPKPLRETLESGKDAREKRWDGNYFFVRTAGETAPYHLAHREPLVAAPVLGGIYGSVLGSFLGGEKLKPEAEREPRPSPERNQQFMEVATQILSAAPAFVCHGRLTGEAAAFADSLAVAMLMDPDPASARANAI